MSEDHSLILSRDNLQYVQYFLSQSNSYGPLSNKDSIITRKDFHKFIVKNGGMFDKEQVLNAIIKQVLPHHLLPLKYEKDPDNPDLNDTCFLSSNCWSAVKSIIGNDFMVTLPDLNVQLEIQIYFGYAAEDKINPRMDKIKMAFKNRMTVGDNINVSVDCSSFHSDPGLVDVYFPLWVPHFQKMIIQTIQNVLFLKHLNLSHNNISSLYELTKLSSPKLFDLNLSYNDIDWPDLIPIMPDKIQDLWLEGNPLCDCPLSEYVSKVKTIFPNLKTLDGVTVYPDIDLPFVMKNSFTNNSCHQLVDQFLHHYFKWFTQVDGRSALVHMYHKDASISVSSYLNPSETSLNSVVEFQSLSRNILRITNYARASESYKTGSVHISGTLERLPFLDLNPLSTTVDVPYFVENNVIQIIVTGVYRDKDGSHYWIGNTFLLVSSIETGSREWKIINQMITVSSPTPQQIRESFLRYNRKALDSFTFEPSKDDILDQFKDLTSMKISWCHQFLESTQWDLESALQSFVDQYKGDLIPEEAFT